MLTPEQLQMVQNALAQMQQSGATQFTYTVTQMPDGTVVQQGGQPGGYPPDMAGGYPPGASGGKAPPTTVFPHQAPQPSSMPQGYLDPFFQSAVSELQRWLSQYERFRMQGSFARLEPVFQAIKQITG